jgi:hypothetical protein
MANLDEVSEKVYKRLLERFGEPIGAAPYAVGVADDRARTDETELDEVTPPGYEKIVKGLKRSKSVENPWAIAWWMKGKGIKPKK